MGMVKLTYDCDGCGLVIQENVVDDMTHWIAVHLPCCPHTRGEKVEELKKKLEQSQQSCLDLRIQLDKMRMQ